MMDALHLLAANHGQCVAQRLIPKRVDFNSFPGQQKRGETMSEFSIRRREATVLSLAHAADRRDQGHSGVDLLPSAGSSTYCRSSGSYGADSVQVT